MHLGDLMMRLGDEGDAASALEALGDIVLLTEVQTAGAEYDEARGEYVANASRRFAALASSEDWLALMTAMERAADPGRAALDRILRWALARDGESAAPQGGGCSCGGGGGGGCHGHA